MNTTATITTIAKRDNAARKGTVFARQMRDSYKAASRAVRIRKNGYAAKAWLPGYGENTPLLAHVAKGGWV